MLPLPPPSSSSRRCEFGRFEAADWHDDADENCFEADRMPLADGVADACSGTSNEALPAAGIGAVLLKGERGAEMDDDDDDDDAKEEEEEND